MSFFRALGAGYLYVRASAVEAKGNSRLKTENGPLAARLLCPQNSPGKNTGVSFHALLQGIFLTESEQDINK